MINYNGSLLEESLVHVEKNRGFLYGDSVFETIRISNNKILFAEEHYFRLMASMRICRMRIPMTFTLEYFENQILSLVNILEIHDAARVRISFFREFGGFYTPENLETSFIITAEKLEYQSYIFEKKDYEIELFKDFYVPKHLLGTLKTNNKMIQILAGIYAKENQYHNCLLLNEDKNVVEAIQSNIFMVMGNQIITPPIADGCLNGIMRKKILTLIDKETDFEGIEQSLSPFDLQKANELFLTNVIQGIQPILKYRKKEYATEISQVLFTKLVASI